MKHRARRTANEGFDAGETLVEVLVAIVVIALGVVGVIGGFGAAVATSGTDRDVSTLNTILTSFAESVRYDVQLQPTSAAGGPLFKRCASSYAIASTPYPNSAPGGTSETVFVTGMLPNSSLSVVVGGSTVTPTPAPTTDPSGDARVTFTSPTGLHGTEPVQISDGTNTAATSLFIGGTASAATQGTPLTSYKVAVKSIGWWNGSTFTTATCDTTADHSDLQEITVQGSVKANSDSLNVVVANPDFVPSPTVVVSSSPASPVTGNTLTFNATVTPPTGFVATPTGTVTWTIALSGGGAAPNCTTTSGLAAGTAPSATASCTVGGASAGTYVATATYSGDNAYNAASGSSSPLVVAPIAPTVGVTATPASPVYGGTITFTATVNPSTGGPTPTGTVNWAIIAPAGTTPTCTATTLVSGTASCSVNGAVVGSYSATATYGGDNNYLTATGTSPTLTVPKLSPTVTTSGPISPPTYGGTLTFTATVNPSGSAPTPTGTVTWTIAVSSGTTPTCTASTLNPSGQGTCSITNVQPRTYTATANYSGDGTYSAASGTSGAITVAQINPSVSVSSTPPAPVAGSPLVFTATITGPSNGPTITGTVMWSGVSCDNSPSSSQLSSSSTSTTPTATATCTINSATAGLYSVTATYSGDSNYSSATGTNSLSVGQASTSTSVTASPTAPTYGTSIVFTATVTSSGSSGTPTGSVVWTLTGPSGTTPSCSPTTLSGGTAQCTVPTSIAGSYSASAAYGGDSNFLSSSSSTTNVTVTKATPVIAVAGSPANPVYPSNSTLTFTATVSQANGAPTPTGSVSWTITDSSGASVTCPSASLSANANGSASATCTITTATPGQYTVVASYAGDAVYFGASGTSNTITVPQLTASVSIGVSPAAPAYGSTITFTATVSAPTGSGGPTPTGSLSWTVNGSSSCSGSTLDASGTATCQITNAQPPSYTVVATYGGNLYYASGPTGTTTVNVPYLTDSVTVSGTTPVSAGQTETVTATISGAGPASLNGTLTWSGTTCTSTSPPANAGTPNVVTVISPGTSATVTCTFTATSPGTTYNISASYADPHYGTQNSNTYTVMVSKARPVVTLPTPPAIVTSGATPSVTYTASVSGGFGTPTGNVDWTINGTVDPTFCPQGTVNGSAQATCTISLSSTPITENVTASYSGNSTYTTGSAATTSYIVAESLSKTAQNGNNFSVVATIAAPAGSPALNSSNFSWNITAGGTCTNTNPTTLTSTGLQTYQATCVIKATQPFAVTATYADTANGFPSVTSAAMAVP